MKRKKVILTLLVSLLILIIILFVYQYQKAQDTGRLTPSEYREKYK